MTTSIGLVVDDDARIRALFSEALRRGGMQVLEAKSGRDALRLARTASLAFVVTDIEMPGVDGLELCRRLRRTPATAELPIVVVSGSAVERRSDAIAAGCDAVLEKPCSLALLLATIRRLLAAPSRWTSDAPADRTQGIDGAPNTALARSDMTRPASTQ